MNKEKKDFIEHSINQLKYIYGLTDEKPNDFYDLQMLIHLHLNSYAYDDRKSFNISKREILKMIGSCLLLPGDSRADTVVDPITNKRIGVPILNPTVIKSINSLYQKYTETNDPKDLYRYGKSYINVVLSGTRPCVQHGDFEPVTIEGIKCYRLGKPFDQSKSVNTKDFCMTYRADCLVDTCDQFIHRNESEPYFKLLEKIKKGERLAKITSEEKLVFSDLVVNLLLNYTEQEFLKNPNSYYHEAVNNLYGDGGRNRFVNQISNRGKLKHYRNSTTHHYRRRDPSDEDLIQVIDYYDKAERNESARFSISYSGLAQFIKGFSIDDVIAENKRIYNLRNSSSSTRKVEDGSVVR